ncbi:MAG TPA: phosphotransferase, partial [Dehalococcoidia bacterium]
MHDLTAALRRTGTIPSPAAVCAMTASDVGGARGVAGRLARLRLEYDADAPRAPATLIAKFAAAPGLTRDLAVRLGLYEREAAFYRDTGKRAGIAVPRVYGSLRDAAGEPVLLLEDLATATAGDLVVGCSLEAAAALLDELARMHAYWWDSRALETHAWLPLPVDSVAAFAGASSRPDAWTSFRRRFGRELPPDVVALGDRMQGDRSVLERLSSPPWTLVHGDLRINNVMFAAGASAEVRAVIDWQTAVRGRGPMDVATLFATSLAPEHRAAAERELLPAYHAALVRGGVSGYSFQAC